MKRKFTPSFTAEAAITTATTYFWRQRGGKGKTKKEDIEKGINKLIELGYRGFMEFEREERKQIQERLHLHYLEHPCTCGGDSPFCSMCGPRCSKCGKPYPAVVGHVLPCPSCEK